MKGIRELPAKSQTKGGSGTDLAVDDSRGDEKSTRRELQQTWANTCFTCLLTTSYLDYRSFIIIFRDKRKNSDFAVDEVLLISTEYDRNDLPNLLLCLRQSST